MEYLVRPRDSLSRIAQQRLGETRRWPEIASLNHLRPPYVLLIGQTLRLPEAKPARVQHQSAHGPAALDASSNYASDEAVWTVARGFLFVIADEVLPSGKVVRKVGIQASAGGHGASTSGMSSMRAAATIARIMNPDVFGMDAPNPSSTLSIGEHASGNNHSRFLSASTRPGGAANMAGEPFFIDIAKAKKAGVVFHSAEDICRDIDRLAQEHPSEWGPERVTKLKQAIMHAEGEVLLEGRVPAGAVKSAVSMGITRSLRFVQVVGVVFTVADVSRAAVKSVRQESAVPLVAESFRQAGGWGGAAIGGMAGAWAAAKIGGVLGSTLFVETGPGALLAGFAGGLIFGTAGYLGADWVADLIDEN